MTFLDKYKLKEKPLGSQFGGGWDISNLVKETEEEKFQRAYKEMAAKWELNPNPDDPRHQYDWRALYKDTKELKPDPTGHFPSKYKEEGHKNLIVKGINTKTGKPIEKKEEEPSFLNKYKFTPIEPTTTTPIEGEGAKAGGATLTMLPSQKKIYSLSLKEDYERKTLEQAGVSQRMRGIGEAPKEYSLEGVTTDLTEATKMRNSLWWSELQTTEDKWKFLKQENWSPELKQADIEVQKLSEEASKLGVNINDWIQTGVYATFFTTLAISFLPLVSQLPAEALNKIAYKVEGKTVKGQQLQAILKRVAYPEIVKPSIFDKKVYAKFIKEGGAKSIAERMKGITITEVTPRFAFGTKLYAGLPADEIAKSIVEVGKVTADMVKGLDPAKVSQVTQTLLNTSPVLANEFLNVIEKTGIQPDIARLPEEEQLKATITGIKPVYLTGTENPDYKEHIEIAKKAGLEVKYGENLKPYVWDNETGEVLATAKPIVIYKPEFKATADRLLEIDKQPTPDLSVEGRREYGRLLGYSEKEINEFLKAVEKPLTKEELYAEKYDIPLEKVKITEVPREEPKETIGEEEIKVLEEAIGKRPERILEKPLTAKEKFMAKMEEVRAKKAEISEVGEKYTGKAYRAETHIPEHGAEVISGMNTAQEKLDYDYGTTGNYIFKEAGKLAENLGIDLTKVPIEEMMWVAKDFKTAEKYGEAKEVKIPEDTIILAKDDGGSLILKNFDKYKEPVTVGLEEEGKVEALWVGEEVGGTEELKPLATPPQIKKAHAIANSKAMISNKGKMKPQYRRIAEAFTGKRSIKDMTTEEAEMFIDALNRLPEPKYKDGKLIAPSIPITMKLTTRDFFKRKYGEPTPIWLLTDQTYYAEKLGIKPLVEPFEKGKMEFDLEFRKSSNLVDKMVNKLNAIAKTPIGEKIKSKVKNIPTKAEAKMAELVNKHEITPPGLSEKEEDVFKYFRNLSKDIWRRENEVREKVDLPPIKYKQAYFRHTADAMAKEMLEGKYPFPQGIKYWSEKMVGKKIFNPMEFQRKLSDDLIDIWSKDIRAVTKAMLWNGLKEIYLAQPSKFLNEQLNAISKDLPEYKNLTPRDQAAYDQTRVMPASTKKWLIDYINQVIKGQETELDASLNRIVTKSGLKGIFDKILSPFGRSIGRKPITNLFQFTGRLTISGVMGWVPRQILRNAFQQVQNLALYGVKATIKSFLPASIDKNLKGLLNESLFLKSYTGFEELPTNLMGKLEKVWLGPYGIVAVNNAKQGMKAAYWNILDLIKNPKFKKYGWADPQRAKDTPKGFLYPSEKEKLLKEMEFGSSATQYQYIPMGMPGVFRYKALIPLTRLQSWWMNYFTKFNREATHRAFKGKPSWSGEDGPTLPWSRRINWLKYLVIGGAVLTALGYRRSFMIGVLPVYISPAGQVALGMYNYATATSDWQKKRALNQIYYSWKAFIPGSLAWRDFLAVWKGEKELEEILFYGKKEEKEKPISPYLKKYKPAEISTEKSNYLRKYKTD